MKQFSIFLLFCFWLGSAQAGDVYSCTTPEGKKVFQATPCPKGGKLLSSKPDMTPEEQASWVQYNRGLMQKELDKVNERERQQAARVQAYEREQAQQSAAKERERLATAQRAAQEQAIKAAAEEQAKAGKKASAQARAQAEAEAQAQSQPPGIVSCNGNGCWGPSGYYAPSNNGYWNPNGGHCYRAGNQLHCN